VGVASRLLVVWAVDGSGPAGVSLTDGRAGCPAGCVGWLACLCWHRRHARFASASCFVWGWGLVGASVRAGVRVGVACCRGSGAVRPGCLTRVLLPVCGWWGVGVGGLVVNCIVDASILL